MRPVGYIGRFRLGVGADLGYPSAHQSIRPSLIQKWQPQSFSWWTDGFMVGRRQKSQMMLHRGRRLGL